MNRLESFVYGLVKDNYVVKNIIRNIYQGFYDLMPNYGSTFAAEPVVHEGCFFGFHDTDPFSADETMVLSNRLTIPLRMPVDGDMLEVGYWSGEGFSQWTEIGRTGAWNYHKGCRLQWMPGGKCIYNTVKDGILNSVITDIATHEERRISWPIDTVSPDGRMATSFSYSRLQAMMPGYGYLYADADAYSDEEVSDRTGLFIIDLERNERRLMLSLKEISAFRHDETMDGDGVMHFVTHTEFSPDGRFVAFLHRWYKGVNRKTRLITVDMETLEMYVSPTSGMVSHYAFNGKGGLVAYCSVDGIDSHVYFTDARMADYKRCGYPKLNSDGHHHFIDDNRFVVDTYPDKYRHARLYEVNVVTDEVRQIADVRSFKRFASPSESRHWACDLHPRCSRSGRYISFDSVHTGVRSLCVMPYNQ